MCVSHTPSRNVRKVMKRKENASRTGIQETRDIDLKTEIVLKHDLLVTIRQSILAMFKKIILKNNNNKQTNKQGYSIFQNLSKVRISI